MIDFTVYQHEFLGYANTAGGKHLLSADFHPIVKLTPNSYHQLIGQQGERLVLRASFFASERVAHILSPIMTKMEIASEHPKYAPSIAENPYEAFLHFAGLASNKNYPSVYLTAFNPTTASCGRITHEGSATWAGDHDAASGTFDNSLGKVSGSKPANYEVDKVFVSANTASIGSSATVTAGDLTATGDGATNGTSYTNVDTCNVNCVKTTPADGSTLVGDDFDQDGTTIAANIAYGSINQSGSNVFSLNTQLAFISKTGYTNLALVNSRVTSNSAPTGNNRVYFYTASGTTPPVINVTYTVPAPGSAFLLNFL